jgi:hypothetical protein
MKKEIRQKLYNFYEQYDPYGFSDFASDYEDSMEAISGMDPETIIEWLKDIAEEDDDFAEEAQSLIYAIEAGELPEEPIVYRDLDTSEVYTESELEAIYQQFEGEMSYGSFEDYLDDMFAKGREMTGGLVVAHWYAVQSDAEDNDWGIGSYDIKEAYEMLRKYPEGRITVVEMGTDRIAVGVLPKEDEKYFL